ncbi:MAG: hypothetical protein ACJAQT_002594 [Akkermansiaceae bacterium]|jgi:hypothetical protein
MSLTSNSRPGGRDGVYFDTDQGGFEREVNAVVSSQGEVTTLSFNRSILSEFWGAPKVFCKVEERERLA